jgi:hypothetical protein
MTLISPTIDSSGAAVEEFVISGDTGNIAIQATTRVR